MQQYYWDDDDDDGIVVSLKQCAPGIEMWKQICTHIWDYNCHWILSGSNFLLMECVIETSRVFDPIVSYRL